VPRPREQDEAVRSPWRCWPQSSRRVDGAPALRIPTDALGSPTDFTSGTGTLSAKRPGWKLVGRPRILAPMRREEAISTLRSYLPALRRDFGVRRIALFGSTARDEARDDSDLDLLVDFEVGPTFDSFMGLKFFLEDQLGQKVAGTGGSTPTTSSRPAQRSGASSPG